MQSTDSATRSLRSEDPDTKYKLEQENVRRTGKTLPTTIKSIVKEGGAAEQVTDKRVIIAPYYQTVVDLGLIEGSRKFMAKATSGEKTDHAITFIWHRKPAKNDAGNVMTVEEYRSQVNAQDFILAASSAFGVKFAFIGVEDQVLVEDNGKNKERVRYVTQYIGPTQVLETTGEKFMKEVKGELEKTYFVGGAQVIAISYAGAAPRETAFAVIPDVKTSMASAESAHEIIKDGKVEKQSAFMRSTTREKMEIVEELLDDTRRAKSKYVMEPDKNDASKLLVKEKEGGGVVHTLDMSTVARQAPPVAVAQAAAKGVKIKGRTNKNGDDMPELTLKKGEIDKMRDDEIKRATDTPAKVKSNQTESSKKIGEEDLSDDEKAYRAEKSRGEKMLKTQGVRQKKAEDDDDDDIADETEDGKTATKDKSVKGEVAKKDVIPKRRRKKRN